MFRKSVQIPLIIMGYFNLMMQFGINFVKKCAEVGIDGLIISRFTTIRLRNRIQSDFREI